MVPVDISQILIKTSCTLEKCSVLVSKAQGQHERKFQK